MYGKEKINIGKYAQILPNPRTTIKIPIIPSEDDLGCGEKVRVLVWKDSFREHIQKNREGKKRSKGEDIWEE